MALIKLNSNSFSNWTTAIPDDSVTTAKIADDSIQSLKNRNLIINGAMQVAQRGTSVSASTSSGYFTIDRMRLQSGTSGTYNSSQQALPFDSTRDVIPREILYYLEYESTTSGQFAGIQHRIEDVRILGSQTVTVSFYAKGVNPNGGSLNIRLTQNFGSGGSGNVGLTDTITLTSSWQRFEITFNVGSVDGKTIGPGNYTLLALEQEFGNTSTDAWNMDVTGLQLELGDVATPFEHESYGETLAKCQRYYQRIDSSNNSYASLLLVKTSYYESLPFRFPIEMRAAPTITAGTTTYHAFGSTASNTPSGLSYVTAKGGFDVRSSSTNNGNWVMWRIILPVELDSEL